MGEPTTVIGHRKCPFQAQRLGSGLLALGLNKGDRVGIWAPNVYEWVLTQFGTALAGLVLVSGFGKTDFTQFLSKGACHTKRSAVEHLEEVF